MTDASFDASSAVVVTGLGLHGGFGDLDSTWQALSEGRSALVPSHRIADAPDLPLGCAVPAAKIDLSGYVADRKTTKYMSDTTAMAVLAAGRALEDAGLLDDQIACVGLALYMATSHIAFDLSQAVAALGETSETHLRELGQEGLRRCNPLLPFKLLLNMPLGLVSIVFGIRGPNFILYPGAEQGALALDAAVRGIRAGRFSRALVGGSAQMLSLSPLLLQGRSRLLAASPESARPYRPGHVGYAPADQAAFLVLESGPAAAERGRKPYATVSRISVGAADRDPMHRLGEAAPDAIVTTGNRNEVQDSQDLRTFEAAWPRATLASFDGQLGFGGAASLLTSTVLACRALRAGSLPTANLGSSSVRSLARVLVTFQDGDSAAAVSLHRGPA
jgi:3-oxoacyl-(acyl-carrier-protein) synthase